MHIIMAHADDPMKVHSKFLENWHNFYSCHADEFDPSTASLLELGGGPTIHSLISACQYVSKITFSDYAETNRREIRMWKENDVKCERIIFIYHRILNIHCTMMTVNTKYVMIDINKVVHVFW